MKFWRKFNISISVYYRFITDLIRRALVYDGVYSVVTYTNLGRSIFFGANLNLTPTPVKGLWIMSSINIYNTRTDDAAITRGTVQNFLGMNTVLQAFYQIKGGWSTQIWASYSPNMKVTQDVIAPNYGGGFAIQKSRIFNLSVMDILKSRQLRFGKLYVWQYPKMGVTLRLFELYLWFWKNVSGKNQTKIKIYRNFGR